MNKVLDVQNLHVSFDTYAGEVKAVRGVTLLAGARAKCSPIVGESGCGKSVTAQTIMKLNPMPPGKNCRGQRAALAEHDIVKPRTKKKCRRFAARKFP